jgi:hypothetical protein
MLWVHSIISTNIGESVLPSDLPGSGSSIPACMPAVKGWKTQFRPEGSMKLPTGVHLICDSLEGETMEPWNPYKGA